MSNWEIAEDDRDLAAEAKHVKEQIADWAAFAEALQPAKDAPEQAERPDETQA